MPLFDGIPRASWVHNLGFGRPDRAMGLVVVQASTVALDFRGCEASACVDLRPEDLAIGMRRSRFAFRKGISFYVRGAYIRLRLDGTYQLLGLEDLVPQVDAPPHTHVLYLKTHAFRSVICVDVILSIRVRFATDWPT